MRNKSINGAAALLLSAALGWSSVTVAQTPEPIAFIGHGVMFDDAGNRIQATPAFIERAQAFYIDALSAQLQPSQKTKFSAERERYFKTGKRPGDQDTLIINAALIDWLIREVPQGDFGDVQGKNNLIKAKLRYRLFPPEIGATYAVPQELMNLLKHQLPDARKD